MDGDHTLQHSHMTRVKPTLVWIPKIPLCNNAAAAAAAISDHGNGWSAWPQESELVDQNEVQQVQNEANILVQQAMLQQSKASQSIVSPDVMGFFRAQGLPIRLEVPRTEDHQAIVPYFNHIMGKESDYPIFQLAKTLQLRQVFGPMPSAQMLLQDILHAAAMNQHDLYIQKPLNFGLSQFCFMQQYASHLCAEKRPQQIQFESPSSDFAHTWRFAQSAENEEQNRLAIVPWKPTAYAMAIQLYATFVEKQNSANQMSEVVQQQQSPQGSTVSMGLAFEFEATQPSPAEHTSPVRPKRGAMSLPTAISIQSPFTPLVETNARRSERQKKGKKGFKGTKDGFPHTWLEKNPTKRQKITALQINSETGEVGPIHTDILRSWGIECGVDPGDLTNEVLMQAPSKNCVHNE